MKGRTINNYVYTGISKQIHFFKRMFNEKDFSPQYYLCTYFDSP